MNGLLLFPVLFPILGALLLSFPHMERPAPRNALVLAVTAVNSAAMAGLLLFGGDGVFVLARINRQLCIAFAADGLSRVFGLIVAVLWPLTAVYSFDYMRHEAHLRRFFAFFLVSYGVVCGVCLAANLATLYLFFELLTLATLPLVMHRQDGAARWAGKRYLIFSMAGAALGFLAIPFAFAYGSSEFFVPGGMLDSALTAGHETTLRLAFVLAFFGFGVKAALFPMYRWLPAASVAPTPVTALLHAVAVVKAGAFACIRLTYYCFGTELLAGTFAQYLPMFAACITILLGSWLALRSNHLKRRLAYSTISNLSYILLGVTAMSGAGLVGAAEHMIFHAFMKITLFFCVGMVMENARCEYQDQIEGLGKRMPVTFFCFTVASLALMGLPPLPGFFSKWDIASASAALAHPLGLLGVAALLVSAVLTALYQMGTVTSACLPVSVVGEQKTKAKKKSKSKTAPAAVSGGLESSGMTAAILCTTVCVTALGLFYGPLHAWLAASL